MILGLAIEQLGFPLLLGVAVLGLALALLPLPTSAGWLLRASGVTHTAMTVAARERVTPGVLWVLSIGGALLGLTCGVLLLLVAGAQGLLVGGALAVGGWLGPRRFFTSDGWRVKFVRAINADTLRLLQRVYTLAGVGQRPVDEAVRTFAKSYRGRSALADFLAECPPSESPVQFLSAARLPGLPLATLLLALRRASELGDAQRQTVLEQHLKIAVAELKQLLRHQAKRQAQTAIVTGVLILLPTLLLTVLAPPLLNVLQYLQF